MLLQFGWIAALLAGQLLHKRARLVLADTSADEPVSGLVNGWISVAVAIAGVAVLLFLPAGLLRHSIAFALLIWVLASSYFSVATIDPAQFPAEFRRLHAMAETFDVLAFILILAWVLTQEPIWGPAAA